jgi:hypothetical protein
MKIRSFLLWAGLILLAGFAVRQILIGRFAAYIFPGVEGPLTKTVVPAAPATSWKAYSQGGENALAILLTDKNSCWLGLAHGLKAIGVPFIITIDYRQALRHKVVLVYPEISGTSLPTAALSALNNFPKRGGTLIGDNVVGGGMESVFGFKQAAPSTGHYDMRWQPDALPTGLFSTPNEYTIRLGNRALKSPPFGTYSYLQPGKPAVATYEDGSAAITQNTIGAGKAYAVGIDLGYFLLKGYNNREEHLERTYDNGFEPILDTFLRFLKSVYRQGEPAAITLGTVPFHKRLPVILTHDVDFTVSMRNAVQYAQYERAQGIQATYFIQTKYVTDFSDEAFFTKEGVQELKAIQATGMEIASHSVAHAVGFRDFPLGSGDERYPTYKPYLTSREDAHGGSILGELRASRFLLEHFLGAGSVVSYRPGHLSNPFALPQALWATGYRYSSSVTANNALTHLPFQLNYGRDIKAEVPVYEFPVTIEDEAPPRMDRRLPQALALADQLGRYGGLFVVLIHPNVLDYKLAFEKGLVQALKDTAPKNQAWFGSLREFGNWWTARDQVRLTVDNAGATRVLTLDVPQPIDGLSLQLPTGWHYESGLPASSPSIQAFPDGAIVLPRIQGKIRLRFHAG